jgi:hypothetical protein
MSSDDGATCSGLMYAGVPRTVPKWVNRLASVSRPCSALASPKSITLTRGWPSTSVMRTLLGLRSRWTIPFWCACSTALHTSRKLEAVTEVETVPVAVVRDPDSGDVLHDDEGPAIVGGACIENGGDGRVAHQRQCFALGLEAREHLGVHRPALMTFTATRRWIARCSAR